MRVVSLVLAVAALSAVVLASSAFERVELYHRAATPRNWNSLGRATPSAMTQFHIALKERNLDQLDRLAAAIADPDSDEYLNFLTKEQMYALTAPAPETFATVFDFLEQHAITRADVTVKGSTLTVRASVASIEKMFNTQCFLFQHATYKSVNVIRQLGAFSLPPEIATLVELVLDISTFPPLEGRQHIIEQRRAKYANQPQQSSSSRRHTTRRTSSHSAKTSACRCRYRRRIISTDRVRAARRSRRHSTSNTSRESTRR
jgi:subtilase family serine protease